jgi:hypothetical protein
MNEIPDNLNCRGSNLERELLRLGGKQVHDLGIRPVARNLPVFTWYSARHEPSHVVGTALVQVAARYAQFRDIDIGIGYALDADGVWQEHAWANSQDPAVSGIVEFSAHGREIYWGARLRTFSECREFCYSVGMVCK